MSSACGSAMSNCRKWLIKYLPSLISRGLLLAFFSVCSAQGEQQGHVDVMIQGIILSPPPCTINNNATIDVDFGDTVDIKRVDGKNYLKDISYTLDCHGVTSNSLKLSIQGNAADFDNGAALDAGHGGLGIELLSGGEKLLLGRAVNFTWPDVPELQAVPVKKAGATLETGEFSVGATMIVDWQ